MEEETGEDTIQAAHKTRQHQGYHEVEVTFGGEADLHKHYRRCKKNPGHTQFIPIGDFKIEHLPPDYRDNLWLDYIRAKADVTCRLSVRYTSESRPKFHPLHPHLFYPFYQDRGYDWMRVGTGWVWGVDIYKEKDGKNCECKECRQPGTQTPKKEWGKVYITTACHVVFDSDEARHTTCHLFYDEGSTHISQCPSLTGLRAVGANIKQDWCEVACVTHDMDLADKLYKMWKHLNNLRYKVWEKYQSNKNVSCDSDPTSRSRYIVIISHPHGQPKHVTLGEWSHREILSRPTKSIISGYEFVDTSYSYNTATCPGSSGAHVTTLSSEARPWGWYYRHLHSEGGDGNNNKSGVGLEHLSSSSVLMEDEEDVSTSLTITLSTSSSTNVRSDTTDGVTIDEVSESEDETSPKKRNQEPKGDASKKEDSTETRRGGRTSNETDNMHSARATFALEKPTTSSGACKKKGKAPKNKKQKKFLISDSDLDDDGDDVDHQENDNDDSDIVNDNIDKNDEDEEDDEPRDLSDDVQQYVNECNDVCNMSMNAVMSSVSTLQEIKLIRLEVMCDNCEQWYHVVCVACPVDVVENKDMQFNCGFCYLGWTTVAV